MNKTYKLIEEKRTKDRVVEAVKHEIRKYIKREKNKPLSTGVDFWKMQCKISKDADELVFVEFNDLVKTIDILVSEEAETLNIEILSTEGKRKPKPVIETIEDEDEVIEKEDVQEEEK